MSGGHCVEMALIKVMPLWSVENWGWVTLVRDQYYAHASLFFLLEPTAYTNSYFGAGTSPVLYSNLGCRGYETTVVDCTKSSYGSFSCSRGNIAGVVCQDCKCIIIILLALLNVSVYSLF